MQFLATEPLKGDFGAHLLAGAYARLSTTRALGFGYVGPIPITAVWEWIDRKGLGFDEAEAFEEVISAIDAETMRRQAKPKGK